MPLMEAGNQTSSTRQGISLVAEAVLLVQFFGLSHAWSPEASFHVKTIAGEKEASRRAAKRAESVSLLEFMTKQLEGRKMDVVRHHPNTKTGDVSNMIWTCM